MFNSLSCQSIPYSPPTGVARYVLVHFKGTPTVLIRHDNRVHEAFVNNKTAMKGGLDFKHMRALFNGWMDQIACSDTPMSRRELREAILLMPLKTHISRDSGTTYYLSLTHCTCADFKFRRSMPNMRLYGQPCKHIAAEFNM